MGRLEIVRSLALAIRIELGLIVSLALSFVVALLLRSLATVERLDSVDCSSLVERLHLWRDCTSYQVVFEWWAVVHLLQVLQSSEDLQL